MPVQVTAAPAKINLYLHVLGRRPEDGYHLLDSLTVFVDAGDELRIEEGEGLSLRVEGPMASGLSQESQENNLIVRAARRLGERLGKPLDVSFTLIKNLPIASGIGGGSSDAAAALRLLAEKWGMDANDGLLREVAAELGQDIPCCIAAKTCYLRGVGGELAAGPRLPETHMVLVNPNRPLPTPEVYKRRSGKFAEAAPLERDPSTAAELAEMLLLRENSLAAAAIAIMPEIAEILESLASTPDCLLARMSGSGATCFGLYPSRAAAEAAAAAIAMSHPSWWVKPCAVSR